MTSVIKQSHHHSFLSVIQSCLNRSFDLSFILKHGIYKKAPELYYAQCARVEYQIVPPCMYPGYSIVPIRMYTRTRAYYTPRARAEYHIVLPRMYAKYEIVPFACIRVHVHKEHLNCTPSRICKLILPSVHFNTI